MYGPWENSTRFIPSVITAGIKNKTISLTQGPVRRDFIYITDVVNAYKRALVTNHIPGNIFNIGTGKQYTNREIVKTVAKIMHKKIGIHTVSYPRRIWDSSFWVADITKTKKKLRWHPQYNIKKGLAETIVWNQKEYQ